MKFRHAKQSDKEDVLRFCTNTFEWGDYIEEVWDVWYSDPNGYLMIAEENEMIAAVSHAYVCPNRNRIWLEGIRVNPDFRRRSIGTELIKKMVQYGKEQGAQEAAGLVSVKNVASQAMMEKNGFVVTSRWIYCNSSTNVHQEPDNGQAKIATLKDKEVMRSYLKQSQIFRAAAENYAHLWRWYHLHLDSDVLHNLIDNRKIIIMTNHDHSIIHGLIIINKNYNNMFQIGYIDAVDVLTLKHLITFVINLAYSELREKKSETLQMFVPQTSFLQAAMTDLEINQYGHFLLYRMEF
ncbi:MAG: GNAT family N-acetyltransferase [Nitrososphaeraceae archaeon]